MSSVIKNIRVGMIQYLNLLPFRTELMRAGYEGIELIHGHPSKINSLLIDQKIDLAPSSSICLINPSGLEMALPLGVCSHGPVQSVYIGTYVEHENILTSLCAYNKKLAEVFKTGLAKYPNDTRQCSKFIWSNYQDLSRDVIVLNPGLKCTPSSATSTILAKMLYRFWFGKNACHQINNFGHIASTPNCSKPMRPFELLIGDEALERKREFYRVIDLGKVWKDLTGLPFVYAVWQSKGAFLNGWRRKILHVGERAESIMHVNPASYYPDIMPTDNSDKILCLSEYWKSIYYKLGPKELRGLLLFLCLAKDQQGMMLDQACMVKLMRWQELSSRDVIHPGC